MKKVLVKELYSFIAAGVMFSANASAQIIYTDIIPDTTINTNGGVYALDLNNDGITDFNITDSTAVISGNCPSGTPVTGTNIYIRITPLGDNEVGNDTTYPAALVLNSKIDSNSFKWKNNANQILANKSYVCRRPPRGMSGWYWAALYTGRWNGAVNKYIPLRLHLDSQKYYGWVRIDVASGAVSFKIKDYAYDTIRNQTILAGDSINFTTGLIENSFASSINLFPNPATNNLTITLLEANQKFELTIADLTGKIIYSATTIGIQKVEVNTQDFAAGIYMIQIQTADFITTKKLILQK